MTTATRIRAAATAAATAAVAQPAETTAAQPAASPEPSLAQQAEDRYLQAIEPLVDDAIGRGQPEVLVDVLAWTLARIANAYGQPATADVLRRFANHLADLALRQREQEAAKKEARAAKRRGLRPH
jgi:hypothetical protein